MDNADGPERAQSYARGVADASYDWYKRAAIRSRKGYRISETLILAVSAAIPTSAALASDNVVAPAILGGLVVVLTGLRAIFHWQDNYLRFSGAREAIEAERRLYNLWAEPYEDAATREQVLAASVSRIEEEEMKGWTKVAAERPKP